MTKHILYKYICNYCEKDNKEYFIINYDFIPSSTGWETIESNTNNTEEDKHICPNCLQRIKLNKLKEIYK